MSEPALIVADPDVVWQTELGNLLAPLDSDAVPSLEGAIALLEPGRPTGLVVGPGLADAVLPQVAGLREGHPELLVVLVVASVSAAALHEAMRSGVYDVLDASADRDLLAASLADAVRQLETGGDGVREAAEAVAPGELVIVSAAKAGEGATAVATALAATLADGGTRSVALIDGDPRFGDVALGLGLAAPELGEGFEGLGTDRQAVLDAVQPHAGTGLMVLSPPRSTTPADASSEQRVIEVISAVQAVAEVVVVDAPFRLVESADLIGYADRVYLVSDPDPVSLKNAMVAVQVLGQAASAEVVELVLNRCGPDGDQGGSSDDIARAVGVPVAARLPTSALLIDGLGAGLREALATIGDPFCRSVGELADRFSRSRPR